MENGIPDKLDERKSVHDQQHKDDSIHGSFATRGKMAVNPLSGLEVTNQIYGSYSVVKATEALDDGEIIQLDTKVTMNDTISDSNQDKSVSILDKLFGSSLTANTSANLEEVHLLTMVFVLTLALSICILFKNKITGSRYINSKLL